MAKSRNRYKNPNQIMNSDGNRYYFHYQRYLFSLAFQLFEWEGLPDSVNPRYLEMSLHTHGQVAFYKDPKLGYIVTQGTPSGEVDHYMLSKYYQATSVSYNKSFRLYNYTDMKYPNMGILIRNNDYQFPSTPSLEIFAKDLAEQKEIIRINNNAQKTPFFIASNDNTLLSMKNIYNQLEGNAPAIFVNENFDLSAIQVFHTPAPYVGDKMNVQKNATWNEVMTFLSIDNANQEKKERMITSEAEANSGQVKASGNIYLKSREEACKRINEYHPELNVSVRLRDEYVKQFQNNISKNEGVDFASSDRTTL
ncbi:upper collar connector [Bacillus phage VMY22]|uniref:Upper collar protein n=1 Tax=Bacillus phage VMY22 TaxID=1734382 RepID=A0A0N9SK16_9CAUD|nr:upper collar connector [Bacillus phage VMY22]ALH46480.1 upper collar protein [Bacillus phage VMY22]